MGIWRWGKIHSHAAHATNSIRETNILKYIVCEVIEVLISEVRSAGWEYIAKLMTTLFQNYGVPDEEIFQTVDLFEARNVKQVVKSLMALARTVSSCAISQFVACQQHYVFIICSTNWSTSKKIVRWARRPSPLALAVLLYNCLLLLKPTYLTKMSVLVQNTIVNIRTCCPLV